MGGRSEGAGSQEQLLRGSGMTDEILDLFYRIGQKRIATSRNEPCQHNLPITLERMGVGSTALGRSRMDGLLSSDTGKHDYDWLLTPPETPLLASPEANGRHQPSEVVPRSNSSIVRSVSTTKSSRFSSSPLANSSSAKPARSSSTTRSSISNTNSSSSYFVNIKTSALNTSTASVSSRPSASSNRSNTAATARTTLVPPSAQSRSSTPIKTRSSQTSPGDKSRPMQTSRCATPTARPRTPSTNLNPRSNSPVRSNSRPSTPSLHTQTSKSATTTTRSNSASRVPATSYRNSSPVARSSSPAPRPRTPAKSFTIPDFPLDVPPNLRTKLPERAVSAGKQRPGMALTIQANSNSDESTVQVSANSRRQASSPTITRGRNQDNSSNTRLICNVHETKPAEKKISAPEAVSRRPIKPASTAEYTGFGNNISKKSIDMALRHKDIRQSMRCRGASVFPHSIGSAIPKSRPEVMSAVVSGNGIQDAVVSDNDSSKGKISGSNIGGAYPLGHRHCALDPPEKDCLARVSKLDIYESVRYDAMLQKEDFKNMHWLHSIEDKPDHSPLSDHRFSLLPEPFGLN